MSMTNRSQCADAAGQWVVSKNIDLAEEYLQAKVVHKGGRVLKVSPSLPPGKF